MAKYFSSLKFISDYREMLRKCNVLNALGTVAVASLCVLFGAGLANAANATSPSSGVSSGLATLVDGLAPGSPTNNFVTALNAPGAGLSDSEAGAILEGSTQTGAVAASAASGMAASRAGAGATTARSSAAGIGSGGQPVAALTLSEDGLSAGSDMKNGMGVWLMPLYKWTSVRGQDAGSFESGYDSGLGGVTLGADYTFADAFRVGLAFNLGAGYANSTGDFNETHSNFDFWGLSLYSAYSMNNFTLMADLGYSESYSEATTNMPTGMNDLKADTTTGIWTVGLTAEYLWETSFIDIIPHVGVRYMNAHTYEYDTKQGGNTIWETEADYQDVWYFPVGVTFQKDFATDSNWVITPKFDVGFIAAAGDLKAESRTSAPGGGTATTLEMQNVDGFAFNGGLGLDFGNDTITFGINYNLLASEHETSHMIFGTFRIDF